MRQIYLRHMKPTRKSASAHYENKKVAITGTLTGVFVPPPAVVLRMAEQGRSATAFVTMAGPLLSSPSEALFSPGITAYSKNGSPLDLMTVGESATLVCTVRNGSESLSGKPGYSLVLEDCQIPTGPETSTNAPTQSPEARDAGAAQQSTNADVSQQIKTQMQQAKQSGEPNQAPTQAPSPPQPPPPPQPLAMPQHPLPP